MQVEFAAAGTRERGATQTTKQPLHLTKPSVPFTAVTLPHPPPEFHIECPGSRVLAQQQGPRVHL